MGNLLGERLGAETLLLNMVLSVYANFYYIKYASIPIKSLNSAQR